MLALMILHYLPEERVRDWYAEARHLLSPDGTLLVFDVMPDASTPAWRRQHSGPDMWTAWWTALAEEPSTRSLLDERTAALSGLSSAEFVAPAHWHCEAARRAGFTGSTVFHQSAGHALVVCRR
ncbi:hypothetical protein [Micromonospora haikouensis]|nr:hypothetical protein [Micromonospora haikouensis]